eukprot:CAMPEP_0172664610 /NCGR_PEP_ID=MMETSP1074-20121228/6714_1 /TAXON_ID=2916 /ORGANISM="Ceratium fusus, Strain PA161109" /LENGTH=88 /DNA_ID=CAMNT_0013480793 /DNA_START=656 /DNA_END=922 /DNA_ORIENTATION=+
MSSMARLADTLEPVPVPIRFADTLSLGMLVGAGGRDGNMWLLRIKVLFTFFRNFTSPFWQEWQRKQSLPFWQPPGFQNHAHGWHAPIV